MGVPDFVKFIARSSPGALCRLPKGSGGSARPLIYDFILIDATNAAQTLGLDHLLAFLNPDRILAKSAIIFALDSQRDRSGTARSHRHALVRIGDLDVHVQKLCSQLAEVYRTHAHKHRGTAHVTASPFVLTSGRGVAGEADYKLLDLQRTLLAAAVASGATALPTFLFISEDSDVLCGAMCGPAAQQVSIATKLQDVLYEPSILRLDRVLAFIATCTDAFFAENEREAAAIATAKAQAAAERYAAKAKQLASKAQTRTASAAATSEVVATQEAPAEEEEGEDNVDLSVEDTAVAPVPPPTEPERDVVRRRRQDGPMVATGVRIELSDSSDDENEEAEESKKKAGKATTPSSGSTATTAAGATADGSIANSSTTKAEEEKAASTTASTAQQPAASLAPTPGELTVASIAYSSSVDMVFLFMIVMGNAVNVPSLVRGATKVDAGSCWQAYCKHKYKILSASEAETGRALLMPSVSTHSTNRGSYTLNCAFLHSILEAVHYADAEPRPPGEEEMNRAMAYLSNAVYAALRYVVGCNLEKSPVLQQTFLDSRPLSETATTLPSLSAVMWLLGQEATRTFTFPLHGLAKRELLSAASSGGGKDATALYAPDSHNTSARDAAAAASAGELDVGEHLVAPVAANAWAVRGARTSNVSVATLAQTYAAGQDGASRTNAAATTPSFTSVSLRTVRLPSVTELLKKCLQKVDPACLAKANLLVYLATVWEYTLAMGVRRIATLTKTAANVARAEGGEQVFTAVQASSLAGNPMRAAKENVAGVDGASGSKSAVGHYVYSFELRRMAPVLQSSDVTAATPAASSSASQATSTAPDSNSGKSAAQQAILAALGVSYDYSKAPRAPENVVNLPHSALDDEDKAELQRLKKVARKERALVASVAQKEKKGGARDNDQEADASDPTDEDEKEGRAARGNGRKGGNQHHGAKGARKSTTDKDKVKGKKRLGKRERLQRQKAMEKSGDVAPAAKVVSKKQKP